MPTGTKLEKLIVALLASILFLPGLLVFSTVGVVMCYALLDLLYLAFTGYELGVELSRPEAARGLVWLAILTYSVSVAYCWKHVND